MRDKGAPLGFSVLPPRIIKTNWFFVAKKSAAPARGFVIHRLVLVGSRTNGFAVDLGKGVAMKGVPSKYKKLQGEPDYVVGLEFGNQWNQHMADFQKIFGI